MQKLTILLLFLALCIVSELRLHAEEAGAAGSRQFTFSSRRA